MHQENQNNRTMEKELRQLLERVEEVRRPLAEKASILRNTIMRASATEWIKGESPRCKKELAMSRDCSALREVKDAINTIFDNRHLLDEILAAGGPNEFFKKYE